MTKKRDRYQSAFGAGVQGTRSALYDMGMALYLLERLAKEAGLLKHSVRLPSSMVYSFAELLGIAKDALNSSISPAMWIYQRLQQNEEAAWLMADATDEDGWHNQNIALSKTLNNKAIVSRGFVTAARRIIAKRAAADEQAESGGEA